MSNNLNETKAKEQSQSLGNVEEKNPNNKNSALFTRIEIGGSPLVIVGDEKQGYIIALGNYKLCEEKKTVEECWDMLLDPEKQWDTVCRLITTIMAIAKTHDEANKEPENLEQTQMKMP